MHTERNLKKFNKMLRVEAFWELKKASNCMIN